MKTKGSYGCFGNFMMYVLAGVIQMVTGSALNGIFAAVFKNSEASWQQLLPAFLIPFVIVNIPLFFLFRSWWYRFGIVLHTAAIVVLTILVIY